MAQSSTPLIVPVARAPLARRDWPSALTLGAVVLAFAPMLIGAGFDQALSLSGQGFRGEFLDHYKSWWKSVAWIASGGQLWPQAAPAYWHFVESWPLIASMQVYVTLVLSFGGGGALAAWVGVEIAKPRDPHIHVRGRQIWRGEEASIRARTVSHEKCAISKPELQIHPDIVLARHQVMQSVMVMGAQGGGKTQILWRILLPLIRQGWKTVTFDLTKGDYTISTPGVHRLFALGDARSSVWAIWRDVKSLPDAESFARGLITESADPMWSNAARGVVVAMLMRLINERGENWRWKDLGETTFASLVDVREFAARHYPPALAAVEDAESKTTQSIRINYMSYLAPLYRFCEEWKDLPETFSSGKPRAFSWIDWLDDDHSADRNIVLQSNAKDKTSAIALIRAMMELQVSHIASLEFSESKTRSIFYMLDELPQLGRLECLTTILEVGRSKGCAIGMAFQDIAQNRQIYKPGEDDKWLAMLGIRIFAQVKGAASGKFVLDQIGNREVARPTNSVTHSGNGYSVSNSWQHADAPVMTADELEKLGPQRDGVKAIVLGHSTDVLELTWPYYTPPVHRKAKVACPAVILNTPVQVNGSEAQVEARVQTIEKSNYENAETPETCASSENAITQEIPEIPEIIMNFENLETKTDQDAQRDPEGVTEKVTDAIAQHIASEAISEAAGISPEAVEIGFALLDELTGSGAPESMELNIVMTPAQMRKARQREREAAK